MSRKFLARFVVITCFCFPGAHLIAHHSISGQFDLEKRETLTGVISDIEWVNPHIYLHLDVTDNQGTVTTWRVESVPIAMLRKGGITKEMLMADGQLATIEVLLARDGTQHLAYALTIVYADGHRYKLAAEAD